MSNLITLQELKDNLLTKLPGLCAITEPDFRDLANRAAYVLYNKTTLIGMFEELVVTSTDNLIDIDTEDYSHILSFRVDCNRFHIVALTDTWKIDKAGFNSFVDMGYDKTNLVVRQYRLPECMHDQDLTDVVILALAKVRFLPVVLDTDYFQISSLEALKNAMIAINHEDESDPDTAAKYWEMAEDRANDDVREFRGPIMPHISKHDAAMTDVTQQLI
jgi:hypothetical protein